MNKKKSDSKKPIIKHNATSAESIKLFETFDMSIWREIAQHPNYCDLESAIAILEEQIKISSSLTSTKRISSESKDVQKVP